MINTTITLCYTHESPSTIATSTTSSYQEKISLIYRYGDGGTASDRTPILFIKFQFYCDRFGALQNWTILVHKTSVDLILNSTNLLYR